MDVIILHGVCIPGLRGQSQVWKICIGIAVFPSSTSSGVYTHITGRPTGNFDAIVDAGGVDSTRLAVGRQLFVGSHLLGGGSVCVCGCGGGGGGGGGEQVMLNVLLRHCNTCVRVVSLIAFASASL